MRGYSGEVVEGVHILYKMFLCSIYPLSYTSALPHRSGNSACWAADSV